MSKTRFRYLRLEVEFAVEIWAKFVQQCIDFEGRVRIILNIQRPKALNVEKDDFFTAEIHMKNRW